MKDGRNKRTVLVPIAVVLLVLSGIATAPARQEPDTFNPLDAKYKPAITAFDDRVKDYVKLRESEEGKMTDISDESTAAELQAHEKEFIARVTKARAGAKPGDIFQPAIAEYIRATIRNEFKGKDRKDLRETVLEADTKGVPFKVNAVYPENKELAQTPPTLLLKLPLLPKQVKYRFVGRHLLLVDRENDLIVDYMLDALP